MILLDYKEKSLRFSAIDLTGNFVKFIGTFDELDKCYDLITLKNRLLPLCNGYILEYRLSNFFNSPMVQKEGMLDSILKKITVQQDGNTWGIRLSSSQSATPNVDTTLYMTLLDSGEVFVSAGDFKADVAKDSLTMIAYGIKKCIEIGLTEDTPVIIQSTTMEGLKGIKNLAGQPISEIYFCEFVNVDSAFLSTDEDFTTNSSVPIVSEKILESQASLYTRPVANVLLSEEFTNITPRAQRHTESIEKILAGTPLSSTELEDLRYFFTNINSILDKTGREPLTVSHILDRIGMVSPFSFKKEMRFRLVVPNSDLDTWEAFSHLFPTTLNVPDWDLCFGAVDENNQALGVLAVSESQAFYSIEWLFVEPSMRRQGVASFLIDEFLNYLSEIADFREIEAIYYDSAPSLVEFFAASNYFTTSFDCEDILIAPTMLANNHTLKDLSNNNTSRPCLPFVKLPSGTQISFLEKMREAQIFEVLNLNSFVQNLNEDLSLCTLDNGYISSAILFRNLDSNILELCFLFGENQMDTMLLIGKAFEIIANKYSHVGIRMTLINDDSCKLAKKIFGNYIPIRKRYIATWNYI